MPSVALTISILFLLGAMLFVVRFVRSRFGATSDLPDDTPDDTDDEWPDDPHSGVPVVHTGGPKGKSAAAEVEEPDEPE